MSRRFWACTTSETALSLGLISELRRMAQGTEAAVEAVAFGVGPSDTESLLSAGAGAVYRLPEDGGELACAHGLTALCRRYRPEIVLFPATVELRAIAAFAAASLGCGLCADCTALSLREDGVLIQTRPTFGGSLIADIISPVARPQMATVRPGIYAPAHFDPGNGAVTDMPAVQTRGLQMEVLEERGLDQNPLPDAKVIVAGGKGLGAEGFAKLRQLAKLLGASIAASRGAVSAGLAPYPWQVGLTGVTVRPELYIAIGISGAVQHIVGMSSARYVVAVNPDRKAPIFDFADLAIVSPWEDAMDALLRRFGG